MAPKSSIRVGAIENAGPNTLVSYLRNAGSAATQIDIAVAFVTSAGLDSILHLLKRIALRRGVRFLTGLYQGFTDPKALKTLLQMQKETKGRLSVQVSRDRRFHWKCYFLTSKTKAIAIIGSSNLTDDGLRQSGEFNAVLTLQKASSQYHELQSVFEKHWRAKSLPLSDKVLAKYEAWRKTVKIPSNLPHVPLGKILDAVSKSRPQPAHEPNYWRTSIDGELSPETDALLKQITDWDKRGWLYFSTWKPSYQIGDRIVFFDLNDKSVSVVEILDRTKTPEKTPDGYHFAAYRRVRGIPLRKLVTSRWKSFKAAGLIKRRNNAYLSGKLTQKKFDRFVANLKETAR